MAGLLSVFLLCGLVNAHAKPPTTLAKPSEAVAQTAQPAPPSGVATG